MELSRRNFLMGAGVVAGAAAVAGLTGCSSEESSAEESSSSESSSNSSSSSSSEGRWSWSTAPEPITDFAESYDCEIAIVGLGVSGAMALNYAVENGADVVALQKLETMHNGGRGCGIFNSPHNEEYGLSNDLAFNESVIQEFLMETNGNSNGRLVNRTYMSSGNIIDWYAKDIDAPSLTYDVLEGNHLGTYFTFDDLEGEDAFVRTLEFVVDRAEENGATILYSTPAVQLITNNDGDVTGVVGQTEDGSYVQVNASKGVVICSGGIEHDQEMLECWYPEGIGLSNYNPIECNTGDSTKMGIWIGAKIEDYHSDAQMSLDDVPAADFGGVAWLHVNDRGERFMNENQPYASLSRQIRTQPNHVSWQIIDSHWMEHLDVYEHALFPPDYPEYIDEASEIGACVQADTIAELAEKLDMDPDVFQDTVDRYNSMVDAGVDTDYAVDPEILQYGGIKDAPFYAFREGNSLIAASAGLVCNENYEVLNEDREVIKGLYVAGNAQGNYFGYEYPLNWSGSMCGRAAASGVMSAKAAMGTLEDGEFGDF